MDLILDANALIYLVKLDLQEKFYELHRNENILIDTSVYEEVVENGIQNGYPDAFICRDFLQKHQIQIIPVDIRPEIMKFRDPGETSCAILAMARVDCICVTADRKTQNKFKKYQIPFTNLDMLYYKQVKSGRVSKAQFREILLHLIEIYATNPERILFFEQLLNENGDKSE